MTLSAGWSLLFGLALTALVGCTQPKAYVPPDAAPGPDTGAPRQDAPATALNDAASDQRPDAPSIDGAPDTGTSDTGTVDARTIDTGRPDVGSDAVSCAPGTCGPACTRCMPPAGATAVCNAGLCDYTCTTGLKCNGGCFECCGNNDCAGKRDPSVYAGQCSSGKCSFSCTSTAAECKGGCYRQSDVPSSIAIVIAGGDPWSGYWCEAKPAGSVSGRVYSCATGVDPLIFQFCKPRNFMGLFTYAVLTFDQTGKSVVSGIHTNNCQNMIPGNEYPDATTGCYPPSN